jgi:hypothetical protein
MKVYVLKSKNDRFDGADILGIYNTEEDAKARAEESALIGEDPETTLLEWSYEKGLLTLIVDGGTEYFIIEEFEVQ